MDDNLVLEALRDSMANQSADSDPNSLLRRTLARDPDLAQFDGQFHFLVSSWTRASYEGLAYWLVTRARTTTPDAAVQDLKRYALGESLTCTHVMALGGIRLERATRIDSETELLSFDEILHFFWADRISALYKQFHEDYRPAAALLQRSLYQKAVVPPDGKMPFPPDLYGHLQDVRRCMTAIGPSCPVWLGTWTQLDESIPTFGGAASIPNPFETGGFPLTVHLSDWQELPSLVASWQHLPEAERRHLRVPLDRLNRALRNVPVVDSAIELGIAIDSLFLAEREADRGEQTLTLRLRAARFLSADVRERRRLGKVFGALYKARSMAVHAGRVDNKIDGFETRALLREGYSLTATALRRIITDGEPDWIELLYT